AEPQFLQPGLHLGNFSGAEVVVQIPGDIRADLLRANTLNGRETCGVCLRCRFPECDGAKGIATNSQSPAKRGQRGSPEFALIGWANRNGGDARSSAPSRTLGQGRVESG